MDWARTTANCFIKIILPVDNILQQTPEKNCLLTEQWLDNNFMWITRGGRTYLCTSKKQICEEQTKDPKAKIFP